MSDATTPHPPRLLLLPTKYDVPPVTPNIVSRPRLVNRFQEGLGGTATLISAPPGFGKTTLVGEWHQSDKGQTESLAWISLDEQDNDINRFLSYLTATLQAAVPEIDDAAWEMLPVGNPNEDPGPVDALLSQLISEIWRSSDRVVLVLDDYHVIVNPLVHDVLDFLLANRPPQLHLILISRTDPPLSLARLRGQGELNEFRSDDLRFTSDEIHCFMSDIAGLEISRDDIAILEDRTEGWVAGLQLASISMRDRQDVHEFIEHFGSQHRFIVDYLVEEVLEQQPEEIQSFLIDTSFLDRLCHDLCDAVTGRVNSQQILELLEQRNLFIMPLDTERLWYRYHHLFAGLLRQRLNQLPADSIAELHLRASHWFEAEGYLPEAVRYALSAKKFDRAMDLMGPLIDPLLDQGRFDTVLHWLDALPDYVIQNRPGLAASYARALNLSGKTEAVEPYLQAIERYIINADQQTDLNRLQGVVATARAMEAVKAGNYEHIMKLTQTALQELPDDMTTMRAGAKLYRGVAYSLTGDLSSARTMFADAAQLSQRSGSNPFYTMARARLGEIELAAGRLRDAESIFGHVLTFAEENRLQAWAFVGSVHINQARLHYERGRLDEAFEAVRLGLSLSARWDNPEFQFEGYLLLARIASACGDMDEAHRATERAGQSIRALNPEISRWKIDATRVLIALSADDPGTGTRWLYDYPVDVFDDPRQLWPWLSVLRTVARIQIARGDHSVARNILGTLLRVSAAEGWRYNAIQSSVLLAVSLWSQGDRDDSLAVMGQLLPDIEREQYVRSILDAGAETDALLEALLRSTQHQARFAQYIEKLLAIERQSSEIAARSPQPLIEPLSERELEVLQLIADGKTNPEIAGELFLVVGTIKTHAHRIYGKLDVRNRTEAVSRARELRLIS